MVELAILLLAEASRHGDLKSNIERVVERLSRQTGQRNERVKCPTCEGTGYRHEEEFPAGDPMRVEALACFTCGGAKSLRVTAEVCFSCDGNGSLGGHQCPFCAGTGRTLRRQA